MKASINQNKWKCLKKHETHTQKKNQITFLLCLLWVSLNKNRGRQHIKAWFSFHKIKTKGGKGGGRRDSFNFVISLYFNKCFPHKIPANSTQNFSPKHSSSVFRAAFAKVELRASRIGDVRWHSIWTRVDVKKHNLCDCVAEKEAPTNRTWIWAPGGSRAELVLAAETPERADYIPRRLH